MRTVFTNSMCAHVWAQLKQPHGRSGSMKFDGAVAYSYSTPVAHIITPKGRAAVALFVPNSWGVTTAGHISEYRSAANQYPQFIVPDIFPHYDARKVRDEAPDATLHASNIAYLVAEYIKERDALLRCPAESWRLGDDRAEQALMKLSHALHLYEDAFGLPHSDALHWLSDAQKIRERRDRLLNDPKRAAKRAASAAARERAEEKKQAQRIEQRRLDALGAADRVAAWIAGQDVRLHYGDLNPMVGPLLRIRGDNVETSMGASVPLEHARRVLRFWSRLRDAGMEYDGNSATGRGPLEDVTLGHFRLNSIDAQGNVRAGCHRITAAEVGRLYTVVFPGSVVVTDTTTGEQRCEGSERMGDEGCPHHS